MKSNRYIFSVLGAALLCNAGFLRIQAQEPPAGGPAGGPGPDAMMHGGPMGGRMEILGFGEMHPGAVVTGAPFTAVATEESIQTLGDGNTINRTTQINISRDSQGRTRREIVFPGVGPLAASGQSKTVIMIFDPVAGAAYALHPDTKIAEKLPVPAGGKKAQGDVQGKFEARMEQEIANGSLKKDDLGVQTIAGISAQGTRYTRTIPAGQMGNVKAIVATNERWYSADLQIAVKTTRNDPRFGETSYVLTSIQRQEPAATLFAVPAGYTVEARKPHMHGKGPHGPGGPPPAGDEAPVPPPAGE
jgi:hypothetical protein